eukprot:Protomagalhaensia_sp_Gyna_25__285@NODE_1133_length_2154_cov_148_251537_g899_i0_p1_GENE_NODE_1133_length_2154_cov_148_251537_g899_i0NODE_1133_length_2154_cov_148_251537_g899_i0_p1_ORF_typecomplete_len418_score50_82DMT_YdcZ/PF04657_13/3_9e11DMT_YdcZ/PF04657_13/2_3e20EamA/PF00892_20/7_3e02EamA/PF00892_20/0_00023CRTlike/PF08627_10/62CRTlike/PF08627_10/1_7e02CRTlike/PF08627_10/0_22_NODE_1133_length_2154_cov_148_251537_g899_i07772030
MLTEAAAFDDSAESPVARVSSLAKQLSGSESEVLIDTMSTHPSLPWNRLCHEQEVADCGEKPGDMKTAAVSNPQKGGCLKFGMQAMPFIAGCLVPLQSALNKKAAETSGNIFFVVGCCYAIDTVLTCLWAWWSNPGTTGLKTNIVTVVEYVSAKPIRLVTLTSGVLGAAINVVMGLVAAGGGTGVYTLGSLLGSLVAALLLQLTGLCWTAKATPHWLLFVGVLGATVGAVVHNAIPLTDPTLSIGFQILMLLASFISGACICFQALISNQLARVVGGFRRAVAWSFFSGLWLMFLVAPYAYPRDNILELLKPRNWWQLAQGPFSIYGSIAVAVSQRVMSGPMVYCYYILGQLLSSTIFDHFGWVDLDVRRINRYNIIGLGLVLAGVILVTLGKLKDASRSSKRSTSDWETPNATSEP